MGCQHLPKTHPEPPHKIGHPHAPAHQKPKRENACQTTTEQGQKNIPPYFPKKAATTSPQKQQLPPHENATCQQQQALFITADGRIRAPSDNTNRTHYSARKQHNQHPPQSNTHFPRIEPTDQTQVGSPLERGQLPYRDRY